MTIIVREHRLPTCTTYEGQPEAIISCLTSNPIQLDKQPSDISYYWGCKIINFRRELRLFDFLYQMDLDS